MNDRGVTLIEALVALAILSVATIAILPAFMTQLGSNTRNAERSAAVSAVQQRLEALRVEDLSTMPTSGTSAPQLITIGEREFEVITRYCVRPSFCNATSRHLTVEAHHEERKVFDVETVFAQVL